MQNIQAKLGSAFGKKGDIDDRLKVCTSTVLSQRIEFQEGSRPHTCLTDMLKEKYINLVPASSVASISSETSGGKDGEGLQQPAQILFPPEKLDYSWRHQEGGAGFMNCGNTCFLNATLQCIVHTPPLTNYMMSGEHAKGCHFVNRDKCILCNLEFITKRSLTGVADSFSPKWFINNLQYIGRHFRSGRQEDAHEFLRLSLEKMQKCALIGHGRLDRYSKETTVINQIFGGFLRSQVLCLKCNARSNTYDPLLDISLDIRNVDSIEKAFEVFVAPDKLELDNAYKCDKCKQKVSARKRFTIHKQPNVLTIQLKRFQYAQTTFYGCGGKISKPIKYPAKFNIRPYMSNKNGPPEMYKLYATIQHEGYSCNSGHYVANVRCGETWFHFNDSVRRQTSLQQCLNEPSAYILFYMKDIGIEQTVMQVPPFEMNKQQQNQVKDNSTMQPTHKFIGPVMPIEMKPSGFKLQRVNGSSLSNGTLVKPPPTPLLVKREKMSFELKPQGQYLTTPLKSNLVLIQQRLVPHVKPVLPQQTATDPFKPSLVSTQKQHLILQEDKQTPRLVMKITDGKSVTIETCPDGKRKIVADEEVASRVNGKKQKQHSKMSGLVPYENESTSDSNGSSVDATPKTISTMQEPTKQSLSSAEKDGIVFDQKLNTTTSVPGNTHLYGTVTMKDKLNHSNPDRPKEWKMNSPKPAVSTPLNRPLSETLSCVTASGTVKQAGSADWHTREDSIVSPSISSSHSSTHSINSTNEWTVLPSGFKSCSNRTVAGWTITPAKPENAQPKLVSGKSVNGSCTESTAEVQEGHAKCLCFSPNEATNEGLCLRPDKMKVGSADEYKSYKKLKKHKKHKNHKNEDKNLGSDKRSNDCPSSLHKNKKKKKHKHSKHEDSKERKRKKEKYVREYESQHKHRDMEDHCGKIKEERETENQYIKQNHADDIKIDRHLKSKYKTHNDDERLPKPELAKQHSDSGSEFVWVEKTVPVPRKPSKSAPVTPCQKWDHYVKDGYKRKSTTCESSTTPITPMWDGLKTAKIVNELENVSHCGYGAPVLAWTGHKSQLDIERETDKAYNRKRTLEEDYNNEYDCGRVKKVKHKHQDEFSRYNGNIFQYEQDKRNKYKTKVCYPEVDGSTESATRRWMAQLRPAETGHVYKQ